MVVGILSLSQSLLVNVSELTIYFITGVCLFLFFRVVHNQGEQMFQWERRASEYLLFNVLTKPFSFGYINDRQEKGRLLIRALGPWIRSPSGVLDTHFDVVLETLRLSPITLCDRFQGRYHSVYRP